MGLLLFCSVTQSFDVLRYAKPGTLLALMGASGAGKSTLLDVLAGRKNVGKVTGEILINGRPPGDEFTRTTAYVTQSDVLFPTHTVKEAILFSAMCRLPEEVPKVSSVFRILPVIRIRHWLFAAPAQSILLTHFFFTGTKRRVCL